MRLWLIALAVVVLTNTSWRIRRGMRRLEEHAQAIDRFVDVGAHLNVVKRDPSGSVLIAGLPPMKILRTHKFGGIIDTRLDVPARIAPSKDPVQWYCSEDQEPVILHRGDRPGAVAIGGMGAGKSTAGVFWLYLRWLENLGDRSAEGGITAPTEDRLEVVLEAIFNAFPSTWYRYRSSDGLLTMCDGVRLRAVSTYRQSSSQGSRVQGFNWSFWLGDELQDQIDEFIHVQARLRAAKRGPAKRLATATAKDDPSWRTFKEGLSSSGLWSFHTMLGPNSPFVRPDHWEAMRKSCSTDREYRRLVLAEDLPPESRVYYAWDRAKHLRPVPLVGARRITSIVLRRKTNNPRHDLLIGNDPGIAKAASIFLDAYELRGVPDPVWWVRAELFTLHKSTEQHAKEVLEIAQKRFGVNRRPDGEIAHVRSQPVGQSDDRPDLNVYSIFKRVGLDVKAAQYAVHGKTATATGHIKRESRIEMVLSLLEHGRLYVDVDEQGKPVAPKLVEAFETMERDEKGRSEHEAKDEHDPTDAPCALGYGLWPWEKEAASALRSDIRKHVGQG